MMFPIDLTSIQHTLDRTLGSQEDSDLFLEDTLIERLTLENGLLKNSTYTTAQGFGLRAVQGESASFVHSSSLEEEAIKKACTLLSQTSTSKGSFELPSSHEGVPLYQYEEGKDFTAKLSLLHDINHYIKSLDSHIQNILIQLTTQTQTIGLMKPGGYWMDDQRPFASLLIHLVVVKDGKSEGASAVLGGRFPMDRLFDPLSWQALAKDALRKAHINLEARPAPAGPMPVVLGAGAPAVLLHEAVGHPLEADFNRKGSSVFSTKMHQSIAAPGVTVIDAGNMQGLQGSLHTDDEGTPTSETVLIEDGKMVGHMSDRLNAHLMGKKSTGNGRRQSYAHLPYPRMTNTYMMPGAHTKEEIIASVQRGIYAVDFSGGQVDPTSGTFVFCISEGYMIENGRITYPIKGATLIGSGPEVMSKITMIGNDLTFLDRVGMCGKEGQNVMVGIGQPTLLVSEITVGGTNL